MKNNETSLDVFYNIAKKIPIRTWVCLVSGMVSGLLCHLYMLTNKMSNWDDIGNFQTYGVGSVYGRWLLPVVKGFIGKQSVPALGGMIFILCIAVSACLILEILNLRSITAAVLLPVLLMTFPSATSTMTYMFTAPCYGVGILLSCFGAYCINNKGKIGYICGMISLFLSLGIYQAYICMAICILLLSSLGELFEKIEAEKIFLRGIKKAVALIIALVSYLLLMKTVFQGRLSDYKGINEMGSVNISTMFHRIIRGYKRVGEYFLWNPYSFVTTMAQWVNILVIVIGGIVVLKSLLLLRKRGNKKKLSLFIFILILFPLALSFIYVMTPETGYISLLTIYQYAFLYIALLMLLERTNQGNSEIKIQAIIYTVNIALLVCVIGCNFFIAHKAYYRMDLANKRAFAYYNRILMAVERQEGYSYSDPIAILGNLWADTPISYSMKEDELYSQMEGVALENGVLTQGVRSDYLSNYLGNVGAYPVEREILKSTEEYKLMSVYPAGGSIQKIMGTWVVKVSEN